MAYDPHALLCLTSRKARFTRVDTASRTIPFRFRPIADAERRTEWELLETVDGRRGRIWAGLLSAVGRVQDALPTLRPPSPRLRLADFWTFGWCVAAAQGEEKEWEAATGLLKEAQAGFALEDEALCPVLKEIMASGDVPEQKTSDFYHQVRSTADNLRLGSRIPQSAQACTQRINQLHNILESAFDLTIAMRTLHGHTHIQITRGPSWLRQEVTEVIS